LGSKPWLDPRTVTPKAGGSKGTGASTALSVANDEAFVAGQARDLHRVDLGDLALVADELDQGVDVHEFLRVEGVALELPALGLVHGSRGDGDRRVILLLLCVVGLRPKQGLGQHAPDPLLGVGVADDLDPPPKDEEVVVGGELDLAQVDPLLEIEAHVRDHIEHGRMTASVHVVLDRLGRNPELNRASRSLDDHATA
jgi:hypothetical protein